MAVSATIFDIQRTSLHDGPGIRTTVFFKGCPLKCIWCHNPESISPRSQVSWNQEKCIHCMECVEACPYNAHHDEDRKHCLDFNLCQACGTCVPVCPVDGLKIVGQEKVVSEVMEVVMKDIEYYRRSGGGITLSGGEPMYQFQFIHELLLECRKNGLHTCLETCGFAPQKNYLRILPLVDLFLFDYKATEPADHLQFTGVDNQMILANLKFLDGCGASIILRCPIIPGLNDNENHFRGIARLASGYQNIRQVEIMAYHSMGISKGLQVGLDPALVGVSPPDESIKASWLAQLTEYGCSKALIS